MKIKINEKDLRKFVRKIMKETILETSVNEISPRLARKSRAHAAKGANELEYSRTAYNMGQDTIGDYGAGPIEKKLDKQVDIFKRGEKQRQGHPFYDPRHPEYKQHSKRGGKVHPDYAIGKDIEEFWVDTGDPKSPNFRGERTGHLARNHPMDLGTGFDFSSETDKPGAFGKLGKVVGKALSGPEDTTHHDSRPGSFYALSHKKEGHDDVKELGDTLKSIGKVAKAVGKKAKNTVKKVLNPKRKKKDTGLDSYLGPGGGWD